MRGGQLIHWACCCLGLDEPRTQLSDAESHAVAECATGKRCVVELGVFEGKTSALLRRVMASDGDLFLVDPFVAGALGFSYGLSIAKRAVRRAPGATVHFVRALSHQAVTDWSRPIDFLFIDADHRYEAVHRDWEVWNPHIADGGLVAFHDSRICPGGRITPNHGPYRVVEEIINSVTPFELVESVDSLAILQRHR